MLDGIINQARQLLILGFRGSEFPNAYMDAHLAGIILFDLEARPLMERGERVDRNIISPQQVAALNQSIQTHCPGALISVDHEGGADRTASGRDGLTRLNPTRGFAKTYSPLEIGAMYQDVYQQTNDRAKARGQVAELIDANAKLLQSLGFNCVFAPVVDIHDPACPIIGALKRAYAKDIDTIIDLARMQIESYHAHGIACVLKHYPGHGRAQQDSHLGITDISNVWQADELKPYRELAHACDMVMVGHLILKQMDPELPASISKKHIQALREFYSGVIVSDDYEMQGIAAVLRERYQQELNALNEEQQEQFIFEKTLEYALNAGVECFIFGNQLKPYEPEQFLLRYDQAIENLLKQKRISKNVIQQAAEHLQNLNRSISSSLKI